MSYINLSSLKPELLVTAINKLEELFMFNCQMTSKQATAMFEGFSDTAKLRELSIGSNNLSRVNKDNLATVINRLKTVHMSMTQLTGQQVTCLLRQASIQTKLNILFLRQDNTCHVDQSIVEQARHNIGKLHF